MITASGSRTANLIAVISILGVLIGLGVSVEAGNQRAAISGPLGLATDEERIYFQAGAALYTTDYQGRLQERLPLSELGLERTVVDMEAAGGELFLIDDGGRIHRCRPEARQCKAIGAAETARTFGTALDLAVDPAESRVFVASAAGHRVDVFGLDGTHLYEVEPRGGFLFPNELLLGEDGSLVVADTNHHRIVAVTPREGGSPIEWEFSARTELGREGRVWPAAMARDGAGDWWVVNMDNGMKRADVIAFSQEGRARQRVALPEGADPIEVAVAGERVLVSDFDGFRLFSVDVGTAAVEPFGDPDLRLALDELRATRLHWGVLRQGAFGVIVLFGMFGLIAVYLDRRDAQRALRRGRRPGDVRHPEQILAERMPPAGPDGWVWITIDPRHERTFKIVFGVLLVLLAFQVLLVAPFLADPRMLPAGVLLLIVPVVFYALLRGFARTRIGLAESRLHVVDVQGRRAEGPVDEAIYSDQALLLKGVMVNFRMFPQQAVEQFVMPHLSSARRSGRLALVWEVLRANRRWTGLAFGLLIAGFALLALMPYLV